MRKVLVLIAVAAFLVLTSANAVADIGPVYWSVNGHWYFMRQLPHLSWIEAMNIADEMTYQGMAGHLATITSAEEAQFIFDGLGGPYRYKSWIGGYQYPEDTPDPAANWFWITGEPWIFTNWAPGAPNDADGGEFYLDLYWDGPQNNWNDAGWQWDIESFIVEYEPGNTPTEATSWGQIKQLYR